MKIGFGSGLLACTLAAASSIAAQPAVATLTIRDQPQTLHLYGNRGAAPVLLASGDGGWLHLAPHVAELLAAKGFFVVGLDVKKYLSSFTSAKGALSMADVRADYRALVDYAGRGGPSRVMLIGVSAGAGLSLLAATDRQTKQAIAGVIGLGLPDVNELGWRWQDSVIYLTHGVPNEPTFSTGEIAAMVAPAPLAAIHSTTDDYVPLSEVKDVLQRAGEPKRLWVIKAADHSFSDNLPELDARLLEAIAWATRQSSR